MTQHNMLESYMSDRRALAKYRSEFFFALRTYLHPEQQLPRPWLSEQDNAALKRARVIEDDEWLSHPNKGTLIIRANEQAGRHFDLVLEQQGRILVAKILAFGPQDELGKALTAHPQVKVFSAQTIETSEPYTPTRSEYMIELSQSIQLEDTLEIEGLIYRIEFIFEQACLFCSPRASLSNT